MVNTGGFAMTTETIALFGINFLAGIFISAICGLVGTFVVVRRLSFWADALAHASLAGIGLSFLIGTEVEWILFPFAVFAAIFVTWFSRANRASTLATTAVFYSFFVGIGVLLVSRFGGGGAELVHLLFGDLMWITARDFWVMLTVGVPASFVFFIYRKRLLLCFLNEDLAVASGLNPRFWEYIFMVLLALVIIVSIKLVGVVLVTTLITVPSLIASKLTRSFQGQFFLSPLLGVVIAILGMWFSLFFDISVGPTIAVLCGVLFALVGLVRG
jgi:ABC-type Mn2+/Zn2+ transport system permease subunit